MKKAIAILLSLILISSLSACSKEEEKAAEPQVNDLISICELATMECYYHNTVKWTKEDAEGFWFTKKDGHLWIEYTGKVKLGIDASKVKMEINSTENGEEKSAEVIVTIPKAEILGEPTVDKTTIKKENFITDVKDKNITSAEEQEAFKKAQEDIKAMALNDTTLLERALKQAEELIEKHINNIGEAAKIKYSITWKVIEKDGNEEQ